MNPLIHGVLSFIVPGLGQILSKKYVRGVLMLVVAIFFWATQLRYGAGMNVYLSIFCVVCGILYSFFSALDAYAIENTNKVDPVVEIFDLEVEESDE